MPDREDVAIRVLEPATSPVANRGDATDRFEAREVVILEFDPFSLEILDCPIQVADELLSNLVGIPSSMGRLI